MSYHPVEAAVVRATVRVLDAHGIVHWNVASGNGQTGLPDRMAILPASRTHPGGRLLCMEFKRPRGGRIAPKQQWWLDRMTAAGALCLVVTRAEQVSAVLDEIDKEIA